MKKIIPVLLALLLLGVHLALTFGVIDCFFGFFGFFGELGNNGGRF